MLFVFHQFHGAQIASGINAHDKRLNGDIKRKDIVIKTEERQLKHCKRILFAPFFTFTMCMQWNWYFQWKTIHCTLILECVFLFVSETKVDV